MLTNLNVTDIDTGRKVFRRDVLNSITIWETRFGFEPKTPLKAQSPTCRSTKLTSATSTTPAKQ